VAEISYAPKRLCQFVASVSETTYYTVPANTFAIVKNIILANNNPGPVSANLSVVPTGGTAGYANRIVPGVSIPANSSITFDMSTVMASGDFISASATIGSVVAVTVSGVEESGNALSTGGTPGASQAGVTAATSTTRPAAPYLGQHIYETDTFNELTWNGYVWQKAPQTQTLAYAQILVGQSAIGTSTTDVAGLSITITVPAGRRIRLSAFGVFQKKTSTNYVWMRIHEGAVAVAASLVNVITDEYETLMPTAVLTPTAGTHTYRVVMSCGANTVDLLALADYPAYILAEDITGDPPPVAINSVPVGQLAYAQNFAHAQTSASATWVDMTNGSVNFTVPAGRSIRVTGRAHLSSSVANDRAVLAIREGATVLGESYMLLSTASFGTDVIVTTVVSPSAGAHTYTLSFARSNGTGTITVYSQPNDSFTSLLVEDVTPTPAPASTAPSSTLGYAEVTANQTAIGAGPTDLTSLTSMVTVVAGRRLRITGHGQWSYSDTTTGHYVDVLEDGVGIGRVYLGGPVGTSGYDMMDGFVIRTPSAGTHTYKLTASRYFGSGTAALTGAAANPAFILVEDITAASVAPVPISNGLAVVQSSNRPGSPTEGLAIFEYDTDKVQIYDGSAWVEYGRLGAWTTYTPTLSNITLGNGTRGGRWMRMGRTIFCAGYFSMGSTSSVSGRPSVGLPVAATSSIVFFGSGRVLDSGSVEYATTCRFSDTGLSEVMFMISGVSAPNGVFNSTTPFAMGTGDSLEFSIIYEAAS
jgi:hypothetical protein